jgi:hypothetical protein
MVQEPLLRHNSVKIVRRSLIPFQKKRGILTLRADEVAQLWAIANARSEPFAKVKLARILLAYGEGERIATIALREDLDRPVVERRAYSDPIWPPVMIEFAMGR